MSADRNERRAGDPIAAVCWLDEETPTLEGDAVFVSAELTDVDEVAVILRRAPSDEEPSDVSIYLPRTQAIALAGQLAAAATMPVTVLPKGHVNE